MHRSLIALVLFAACMCAHGAEAGKIQINATGCACVITAPDAVCTVEEVTITVDLQGSHKSGEKPLTITLGDDVVFSDDLKNTKSQDCGTKKDYKILTGSNGTPFNITINDHICKTIKRVDVDLPSEDVCDDTMQVVLTGGTKGNLKIILKSDAGDVTVLDENRAAGTYNEAFKVTAMPLPEREFYGIAAIWTSDCTCRVDVAYGFQVYGKFRCSQYNTPQESDPTCGGSAVAVCFTTAACAYTAGTLKSIFESQVKLNGSGISISNGGVVPEAYCQGHGFPPTGSCVGKDIFRSGNPPKGTCGGLSNTTVAKGDDSPFKCGDEICIFTSKTAVHKTVTDRCPACTGKKQLDNYTTDGRCTGIPDLGNFIVVKVTK